MHQVAWSKSDLKNHRHTLGIELYNYDPDIFFNIFSCINFTIIFFFTLMCVSQFKKLGALLATFFLLIHCRESTFILYFHFSYWRSLVWHSMERDGHHSVLHPKSTAYHYICSHHHIEEIRAKVSDSQSCWSCHIFVQDFVIRIYVKDERNEVCYG